MTDLDPTRELSRQSWRERIASYIAGTSLHECVGGYENDDDSVEGKN